MSRYASIHRASPNSLNEITGKAALPGQDPHQSQGTQVSKQTREQMKKRRKRQQDGLAGKPYSQSSSTSPYHRVVHPSFACSENTSIHSTTVPGESHLAMQNSDSSIHPTPLSPAEPIGNSRESYRESCWESSRSCERDTFRSKNTFIALKKSNRPTARAVNATHWKQSFTIWWNALLTACQEKGFDEE